MFSLLSPHIPSVLQLHFISFHTYVIHIHLDNIDVSTEAYYLILLS